MDAAYRFGRIQVSCEGYDYPEDPYVLKGSCGVSTKGQSSCGVGSMGTRGASTKGQSSCGVGFM